MERKEKKRRRGVKANAQSVGDSAMKAAPGGTLDRFVPQTKDAYGLIVVRRDRMGLGEVARLGKIRGQANFVIRTGRKKGGRKEGSQSTGRACA